MNLFGELEKLRMFMQTPAPYASLCLGILIALCSLSQVLETTSKQFVQRSSQFVETAETGDTEKFVFSHGHKTVSTIDVLGGVAWGFKEVTTFPALAVTRLLMAAEVTIRPEITVSRYEDTFVFLFFYLNAYFWLFMSFFVYSVHWESNYGRLEFPIN